MEKKTTKPLDQEIDNIITSDNNIEENNTTNIPEEPTPTPIIEEENKETDNNIEETPEPARNKPIVIDRLYRF